MPNWATVTRKIYGTKENVKRLYDAIEVCNNADEPIVKNGFGKLWLGCIVTQLGGDWEKVRCRGEIYEYSLDGDCLTMQCMEAWGEQSEFRHFLERVFCEGEDDDNTFDVVYYCSEPGMCEYYTNDPDCNWIYVDVFEVDENGDDGDFVDSYEAEDNDDLFDYLDNNYDGLEDEEFETIEEAVAIMKKHGYVMNVHEYEYQY